MRYSLGMKIKEAKDSSDGHRTFTLRLTKETMELLDKTVDSFNLSNKGKGKPKLSRQKLVETILKQVLSDQRYEIIINL